MPPKPWSSSEGVLAREASQCLDPIVTITCPAISGIVVVAVGGILVVVVRGGDVVVSVDAVVDVGMDVVILAQDAKTSDVTIRQVNNIQIAPLFVWISFLF